MTHRLLLLLPLVLCPALWGGVASAQVLKGDWVTQTESRIEATRKADLRVIVLGRDGAPAAGARVRIEQVAHAMQLGVAVGPGTLPADASERPVYRVFNAVSLDRVASWPRLEAGAATDFTEVERAVAEAEAQGLSVRWGAVVSADAGRLPDRVAGLRGDRLSAAIESHVLGVLTLYDRRVEAFDLYADVLDHDLIESRLGVAALRRLYDRADALSPRPTLAVRYRDTLTPERVGAMLRHAADLRQSFVRFEAVAIEQRLGGILVQAPLGRAFDVLGGIGADVTVASLEVGGPSGSAASVNLETFLRTAFAEPRVTGVFFAGLRADELVDPNAALVGEDGEPTASGSVLDAFFRELWWTDLEAETDGLGNVYARVFVGTHRVSATLPDGSVIRTAYRVRAGEAQQVLVLEPDKAER